MFAFWNTLSHRCVLKSIQNFIRLFLHDMRRHVHASAYADFRAYAPYVNRMSGPYAQRRNLVLSVQISAQGSKNLWATKTASIFLIEIFGLSINSITIPTGFHKVGCFFKDFPPFCNLHFSSHFGGSARRFGQWAGLFWCSHTYCTLSSLEEI